jgi:ABC-2 type transport system permease protein
MAVYDEDRSSVSREFIQQFFTSEYFVKIKTLANKSEIDELLDGEKVRAVLVVPSSFSKDIQRGKSASVQIIVDGANSNAAATVLGYINSMIQQYSLEVMAESFMRIGGKQVILPIDFQPRVWYNPELKSAKFLVPGLIAFILMVAVVRERELGTMEQIMVSPIKPIELILGKTIPYIIISLIATIVILFFGYILFDVSIKGSISLLTIVTLLFLIGGLGVGMLISTLVETQQLAFMIAVIISMLPTFILSGFVFPIRNMPVIIQGVTYLIPARYFLVALRSIILKGAGLSAFWDQAIFLTVFAAVMIGVSSLRMRKFLS